MPRLAATVLAIGLATALSGCFADLLPGDRAVSRDGTSRDSAVPVAGVDAEYAWLAANRPGWDPVRQTLLLGGPGEAYDLFLIRNGSQTEQIFFDISSFYGKSGA